MNMDDIRERYRDAESYRPGDSEKLNGEILALMRRGQKTASCEAMRVFENGTEAMPVVGRVDVALDWENRPALIVKTVEVLQKLFREFDESLVAEQGEFRDLEHWRNGYRAYLTRNGGWSEDLPMMMERFQVIEDLGAGRDA